MTDFNYFDQAFFHRSLRRAEFNLCLTIPRCVGPRWALTPHSQIILWHRHKKWWELQHREVMELLRWRCVFLSVKLTAEQDDRAGANHLINQTQKWEIWRVPAVYQSFLWICTASSSGCSCSLALLPLHLEWFNEPAAKIQLLQIHPACEPVHVTFNSNLCFLIRGLGLVHQPGHPPQIESSAGFLTAHKRRQMSIQFRWSQPSSQKTPNPEKQRKIPTKSRLLFHKIISFHSYPVLGPVSFFSPCAALVSRLKLIGIKALSLSFMGKIMYLNPVIFSLIFLFNFSFLKTNF